jgi:hypothetical protein
MTRDEIVRLILKLQDLRAWLEEDVTDTIEGQATQTLIDYLMGYLEVAVKGGRL